MYSQYYTFPVTCIFVKVYKQRDHFKKEFERCKKLATEFRVTAEKLDQMNQDLLKKKSVIKQEVEKDIEYKLANLQKKVIMHKRDFERAIISKVCFIVLFKV